MAYAGENRLDILIVIDVQNNSMVYDNDKIIIENNLLSEQIKSIDNLIDNNELIIFSKNFHPIDYSHTTNNIKKSINKSHTCSQQTSTAPNKTSTFIFSKLSSIQITKINRSLLTKLKLILYNDYDLSYLFSLSRYNENIINLINDNNYNAYEHTISLGDTIIRKGVIGWGMSMVQGNPTGPTIIPKNSKTDLASINVLPPKSRTYNRTNFVFTKNFIQLNKGEFCDTSSYSAFNYHNTIEKDFTLYNKLFVGFGTYTSKFIAANFINDKNMSTGLWEYIIKYSNSNIKSNILNITVCGLFGNISVIYTIIYGYLFWNKFYKSANNDKTINFIYEISGTLFLPNFPTENSFNLSYTDEDYNSPLIIKQLEQYFDNIISHYDDDSINSLISFDVKFKNVLLFKYKYKKNSDSLQIIESYKYNKYKQKYINATNNIY